MDNIPDCININCFNKCKIRHITNNKTVSFKPECSKCSRNRKLKKEIENITFVKLKACIKLECPLKGVIVSDNLLHLDHIDGNRYNNTISNIQTLCFYCHSLKTEINKDYNPNKKIKLK